MSYSKNTPKKFDVLVYIGRFQPFHNGHLAVVKEALKHCDRLLILVGSANASLSLRNPFSYAQRHRMIVDSILDNTDAGLVDVLPLNDYTYRDDRWMTAVRNLVEFQTKPSNKVGLVGMQKDNTSYYLTQFPEWGEHVAVEPQMRSERRLINATDIREAWYSALSTNSRFASDDLPAATLKVINEPAYDSRYEILVEEYHTRNQYKALWEPTPYPVTFTTVDSVVIQSGHVLLVQRKFAPGRGQWALPGGFINTNETLLESALRELREETKLKVPEPVLRGNVVNQHTFDDPHRSPRGRTITTAFHIALPSQKTLPQIKAASDAKKAVWVSLNSLDPTQMFEDHFHIINYFV